MYHKAMPQMCQGFVSSVKQLRESRIGDNTRMPQETIGKRKRGRQPEGVAKDGTPEMVSRYPRFTLSMTPTTKARLEAAAMLTGQSAWKVVEQALVSFVERLPPEDRKAIEAMARRIEERNAPTDRPRGQAKV
jgi:hypothetical protein